jgi:hypothetical protein
VSAATSLRHEESRRRSQAFGMACTLPCLRLVGQFVTGDYRRHRAALRVAEDAIFAAFGTSDTDEHAPGRRFWLHARPYVRDALEKWTADGCKPVAHEAAEGAS